MRHTILIILLFIFTLSFGQVSVLLEQSQIAIDNLEYSQAYQYLKYAYYADSTNTEVQKKLYSLCYSTDLSFRGFISKKMIHEGADDAIFSPNGKYILTTSYIHGLQKLYDSRTGKLLRAFNSFAGTFPAHFSMDGNRMVTSIPYDYAGICDIESGKLELTIKHPNPDTNMTNTIFYTNFSPDGNKIITLTTVDNIVKIWDSHSGKLILNLAGHTSNPESGAFSPDGKRIVTCGSEVLLWDSQTGKMITKLKKTGIYNVACFSNDGKYIAININNNIGLLDSDDGSLIKMLQGYNKYTNHICFSSDNKYIAANSDSETINIWEVQSGKLLKTISMPKNMIEDVCFSPDNKLITVTAQSSTVKIWTVGKWDLLYEFSDVGYEYIRFSPDGKRIILIYRDYVEVLEINIPEIIKTLDLYIEDLGNSVKQEYGIKY